MLFYVFSTMISLKCRFSETLTDRGMPEDDTSDDIV